MSADIYNRRTYGLPGAVKLDQSVYTQGLDMLTSTKDRRATRREKMNDVILFRMVSSGGCRQFLAGELRDISSGGVLFETSAKLSEGDMVDIFFKRRLAYADSCARAEVLRVNNLGSCFEVGAKFV